MTTYTITLELPDSHDLGETAQQGIETVHDVLGAHLTPNVEGVRIVDVAEQPPKLPVHAEIDHRVLSAAEQAAERMDVSFDHAVDIALAKTFNA